MKNHDRGIKKWQFAFGMPELIKSQRDMWRDSERQPKPIIDEYEIEEFERKICEAMADNVPVKLTIWADGFTSDIVGRVHYLDAIHKQVRLVTESGEVVAVDFADIVGVVVVEY